MMKETTALRMTDKLRIKVYASRAQMGEQAALDVSEKVRELLEKQAFVNMVFAAAPSQNEFLAALSRNGNVDWSRINAFHLDEYVGLDNDAPQRFSNFLKERLFGLAPFHEVHYLDGNTSDIDRECRRYADLLRRYPTDIACLGIGENTHIAFNDPHVARFDDPLMVKPVELARASRQQQVHDGGFPGIALVPAFALTLTIPALLAAKAIYCVVPGSKKAMAVYHTLHEEISEAYPSTVLRIHNNATLYLDHDSSAKI